MANPDEGDPVHQGQDDQWYFYDENGQPWGPWPSEDEARKHLRIYAKGLLECLYE